MRGRWVRRLGIVLALLSGTGGGVAVGQEPDPVRTNWLVEDGLPHNAVTALRQTGDGYLWVGTAAGLARFDGLRFASVSDSAAAYLKHGYVWALHEDTGGALWIGTGDGLARIAGGEVTGFGVDEGLRSAFVRAVAQDRAGALWVGTYGGGACTVEGTGFACFGPGDGLPSDVVGTLYLDRTGTFWAGTDGGLAAWRGGRFEAVPGFEEDVIALTEDAQGTLWVGTGTGLFRLDDGVPVRFGSEALGAVRSLLAAPDGTLWVGSETNGPFLVRDGAFAHVRVVDERTPTPFHRDVRALLRDREDGVWIGTNGGGLSLLRRGRVRVLAAAEGLPSDIVNAVFEDRQGRVWLGTTGGLARLNDGDVQTWTAADGLPDERVFALAEDREGRLWIGTNGGGLARFDSTSFTTFTTADGLPSDVIFGLYTDRSGTLWVGSKGLSRWTGDGFETFTAAEGLAEGLIVAFAEAPGGALWFGSASGGLSRYAEGRFTTYTEADGLPSNAIRALQTDGHTLWIGTRGAGLARFRDGAFTTFTTEQGLPDDIIFHMLDDGRGHLWLNTARRGIVRVRTEELDAVARGEIDRVTPLVLGRADGLRSTEGVGGFHPSGWRGADGRLWFATHHGVAVIDPENVEASVVPPAVHIEEIFVDEVPMPVRDGMLRLGPDADRIEIHYTGLGFADPQNLRFRHRLDGKEEGWTQVGTQRTRTYANLAPGRYTFRVTAANPDGVWNTVPAELALVVEPPWWQQPWALVLWPLLLGAGLWGFVRWREQSLKRHNEELAALVAERTETVEAQSERLRELDRSKSRFFANLSHEFRTPLTLILGPLDDLLARADGIGERDRRRLGGIRQQGERLLRLINQLLDLSKLDAGQVVLAPQRADLAVFVRRIAESFAGLAERGGLTLDVQIPPESVAVSFDPDKLEQVISNLLSNALKFTPTGGKVQVEVAGDAGQATVHVRDTGPGIVPEALPHVFDRFYRAEGSENEMGTGIGLALARELVELHGGALEVESASGFGSTFTVRLPLAPGEGTLAAVDEVGPSAPSRRAAGRADDEADGLVEAAETAPEDAPLVLLVEDRDDVRAFLRDTLAPRYRIAEAADGEAGLAAARAERPDLVVSDVMMPGLDGFELVRRLRADEALAPIPVILLTARADDESRLEGLGAGADDYLAKPFRAAELRTRVENLIEIRRLLRRRFSGEVVVRPTDVTVPSADAAFLDQVRTVVEAHIGDTNFSVEWLADEVHLSRRQLHRKLRALTDLSTAGFIRTMRLERAAQLLEQQAGTIAEVAYAVGFRDADYFGRLFRQTYGVPPSEYRESSTSVDAPSPPVDRT